MPEVPDPQITEDDGASMRDDQSAITQMIHGDVFSRLVELSHPEELHEDLIPYVSSNGSFAVLQHPLHYSVPYIPELNVLSNNQYLMKKAAIA